MKKILLLVVTLSILLSGCSLIDITFNTTTSSTTTETSATTNNTTTTENSTTTSSPTTETTTIENIEEAISNEFSYLEGILPAEVSDNYVLPSTYNSSIVVSYYQDSKEITNNIFIYTPNLTNTVSELRVVLSLMGTSESRNYNITMLENEDQYYDLLRQTTILNVIEHLENDIPDELESDFKLPEYDIEGLEISYDFDTSYVYNDYFVFPFPETNTFLNIEVDITFMGAKVTRDFNVVMKGLDNLREIPKIYINTDYEQPIESKEEYLRATFSMTVYDANNQPFNLLNNLPLQVRARGNSTLYMPKKSFKMKFDNKTSLLFNHQEKDWVLLANFSDQSLIRAYLAHNLSESMNMEFSPKAEFVDVYVNDEYLGNYLLTDQIEVTNDRVNIEEHSTEVDTGYLIEMDKRQFDEYGDGIEGIDFFVAYGYPYVIKSPQTDSEFYSNSQYLFIENYINAVHETLMNRDDYSNLIVESTFIDWFIIQEVFQNVDSGYSSVYMYKDKGERLKMGPVWDFDLSLGNPGHLGDDLRQPEGWYTSLWFKNIWFNYLMEYPSFRENLKTRWNELYNNQILDLLESVYPAANSITKSRYLNFNRWEIIGIWEDWYTAPEILAADNYQKQIEFLYNYLDIRTRWLNEEINKF